MDRNFLLAMALSMLVFTGWSAWQASQRAEQSAQEQIVEMEMAGDDATAVDETEHASDGPPPVVEPNPVPERAPAVPALASDTPRDLPERVYPFEGELFRAELTNRGGALRSWRLLEFSQRLPDGEQPIELIRLAEGDPHVLSTPFGELGLGDLSRELFEVEHQSASRIDFVLRRGDVLIRKRYELDLDAYGFDLTIQVENHSQESKATSFELAWPARMVLDEQDFTEQALIARRDDDVIREMLSSVGSAGFMGGLFGGGDEYREPLGPVDWAGVELKFFVSAVVPDEPADARAIFDPIEEAQSGVVRIAFVPSVIAPGGAAQRVLHGYLGPKEKDRLEAIAPSLIEAINLGYSWLAPLTLLFRWLLPAVYAFIPNYGVVIIIITIAVRLLTAPIMAKQMKSMERMRELQPRMKEIQENHKDDRQKQSEATMALYKETGVNPLSGCFPMLLQFPVFIGLFFALQSSIELRHAPFMLWIDDLASPESLFSLPGFGLPVRVLPLVMGASMAIQQKMTPQTAMDPAQAKMMMTVMPIMMTVLFYQFPSGLVLYWMVSNFLGIAHQLWVRRKMESEAT